MVLAHAFLGNTKVSHTFRFNPDSAQWQYVNNIGSMDTIGGRVVQLLSVNISALTIAGRAGSRGELQRLADNMRSIMEYHVRTSQAVQFKVPSRNWHFLVYVQAMPQIGWDVAATSYPYSLQLAVEEDLSGVISRKIQGDSLTRLAEGIGYNPAVHGGDVPGFTQWVDTVLKLAPSTTSSSGNSTDGSGGSVASGVKGYDDPMRDIKGLVGYRQDMGVDYGGSGPVYAVGPGVVRRYEAGTASWPGGSYIGYVLTDGPAKGKGVYFAENLTLNSHLKVGSKVDSGTQIAELHSAFPHCETGWTTSDGQVPLAYGCYNEGQRTAAGDNFDKFMQALGTKVAGTTSGRSITCTTHNGIQHYPRSWK